MRAAGRPCILASAALLATGAIAGVQLPLRPGQPPVRHIDTRLVDASSDIFNVPINLFDDIANIPSNEIQGLDVLSNSLFFGGDWWVPNATNLWGTDPGDIGHYMGLLDIALPFSQISGLDQPEIDPTALSDGTAGLAQQIAMLAAAELPVSASCDAQTCYPMTPPEVITGSTAFDRDIGFFQALGGTATTQNGEPFGLFSHWLQVPLSELTSGNFTFNSTTDPGGIIDPSPDTGTGGGVASAFGFDGTTGVNGTGAGDYMPWENATFKLNLLGPFQDFYNSLLATPSTSGIDGTGIDLPSLTDLTQAFQNFAASTVVAFDPFVEGSPACPALCDIPAADTQTALVQDILAWDPSNTTIQDYLSSTTDSTSTQAETDDAVALLQTGYYNLTPDQLATYDADLAAINPELPALFTNDGIVTDPNYVAYAADPLTTTFDPTYGGYDPNLDGQDLLTLLTNNDWNFSSLNNANTVGFLLDPTQGDPGLTGSAASASSLDPSMSTDLSALMSSLGATAGADSVSQILAEVSAQISADLSSFVPQSLLSMF
ncbi:hypothetical protein [Mycobacterium sp.]|uniref:hypothetical protein n=1 Tax=Mycobacterium sp. TaxID=1785 RepID=UPI0031D738DA